MCSQALEAPNAATLLDPATAALDGLISTSWEALPEEAGSVSSQACAA
jgi:hypothetical protein